MKKEWNEKVDVCETNYLFKSPISITAPNIQHKHIAKQKNKYNLKAYL